MKRLLVIPDLHLEDEDKRAVNAMWGYIAAMRDRGCDFDECVQLGDLVDFAYISDYKSRRSAEGKRLQKTFDYSNRFLDDLCAMLGPSCNITILEGNHDYRLDRYVAEHPELEGVLDLETALHFGARGITYVKSWSTGQPYSIGKANFIHGIYTGQYHARQHADAFTDNIFYGHAHDIQCFSRLWRDKKAPIVAQSFGCLQNYHPTWTKGVPNRWQQAIGEFVFNDKGLFNYNVIRIFNGVIIDPHTGEEINGK